MDAGYAWKLSKFGRLTSQRLRFDDDLSDRLNYQFTGLLLFIFIGIIGIRQYTVCAGLYDPEQLKLFVKLQIAASFTTHILGQFGFASSAASQNANATLSNSHVQILLDYINKGETTNLSCVGKPIQCWTPQEFTRSWEEYAENYCWVSSTFFIRNKDSKSQTNWGTGISYQQRVHMVLDRQGNSKKSLGSPDYDSNQVPAVKNDDRAYEMNLEISVNYYQWAPILLAIQALLFYIPCLVWRLFQGKSGFHLKRIMQLSAEASNAIPDSTGSTEPPPPKQRAPAGSGAASAPTKTLVPPKPFTIHEWHSNNKSVKSLARYLDACLQRQIDFREARSRLDHQLYAEIQQSSTNDHSNHSLQRSKHSNRKHLPKPRGANLLSILCCCCLFQKCFRLFSRCLSRPRTASKNQKDSELAFEDLDSEYLRGPVCCYSSGNYLVGLYFIMKILYIANVLGQMYLMELYTGVRYDFYGLRVLYDLAHGVEWRESGHFPRVTFCEFEAVKLSFNHKYVLQCVLPMNMFLEKIYIFLWLWFLLIGIITLCSVLYWSSNLLTRRCRIVWIYKQLTSLPIQNRNFSMIINFVENYLGLDGTFLLQLISNNHGSIIVADVIGELYLIYEQRTKPSPPPVVPARSNSRVMKPGSSHKTENNIPYKTLRRNPRPTSATNRSRVSPDDNSKDRMAGAGSVNDLGYDRNRLRMGIDAKGKSTIIDPGYVHSKHPLVMHGQIRGARRMDGVGGSGSDGRRVLGVVGIEAEENRDVLRHPAEWLTMVGAEEGAVGSSLSSRSGSDRMMGVPGIHMRMDIRDMEGRRSGSPPPIPNRGTTPVSGQNSEDRSIASMRDDNSRHSNGADFEMQGTGYYQDEDVGAELDREAEGLYLGDNRDDEPGMGFDDDGMQEDGEGDGVLDKEDDRDMDQISDMDTGQRNQQDDIV
ncbi:Innexin inx3 [Cichlidogyrus casuarinus]|uniref:Innexin n=1 Tax=Cichlidogyrus casuarinus TaxID=1844966 RepID=A0ABD2Q5L5_9PLAT